MNQQITYQHDCCGDSCNIRIFNRFGGQQSFIFEGYKEKQINIGDVSSFVNRNFELRAFKKGRNYKQVRCSTKIVTKDILEFLAEFKLAIQAWVLTPTDWETPIYITDVVATLGNSKDNLYFVDVTFLVAKEISVQTQ